MGKLQPVGQIQPAACFYVACKLFYSSGWEKSYFLWHETIFWNSISGSPNKVFLEPRHVHRFTYCTWLLSLLKGQNSNRTYMTPTVYNIYSGPLQKKLSLSYAVNNRAWTTIPLTFFLITKVKQIHFGDVFWRVVWQYVTNNRKHVCPMTHKAYF